MAWTGRRSSRRNGFFSIASVGIAAALATACATAPAPQSREVASTYRVGPPDQLFISILPQPVIERSVVVRPDGKISMDLIGDVVAINRTVEEIAADIEQRISRYKRDARATVYVSLARSAAVTVFGEVRRPGTFQLQRDTRVAEAIGLQGGSTLLSWRSRTRVIRSDGQDTTVLRVNLAAIQRGDLSTNILLTGGDIIVIPPNPLARVGYFIQTLLFPFTPVVSGAVSTSRAFGAF